MAKKNANCSFCNRNSKEAGTLIEGQTTNDEGTVNHSFICAECVEKSVNVIEKQKRRRKTAVIPTPKQVFEHLNRFVIGQEECKRSLSLAVINHYKRLMIGSKSAKSPLITNSELLNVAIDKSNVLLIGPTGSGKTLLAKSLAEFLDVPFAIGDATTITEAGYVGEDVENLLLKLLRAADFDLDRAERGIIFIDEIDKLRKTGGNTSITRDVSGEGVQSSLLKMIEGTDANLPPQGGRKHPEQQYIQMDTTNILFIVGGSFVGLDDIIRARTNKSRIGFSSVTPIGDEVDLRNQTLHSVEEVDLVKYGMIPELIGRLPVITVLDELSLKDMIRVLTEPENAIIKQFQKLCCVDGIDLQFTTDALSEIARLARDKGTGARGLRSVVEMVMKDIMFDLSVYDKKIVIDEQVVLKTKSLFTFQEANAAA